MPSLLSLPQRGWDLRSPGASCSRRCSCPRAVASAKFIMLICLLLGWYSAIIRMVTTESLGWLPSGGTELGGGDRGALRFWGRKGNERHPVPVPASPLGARSKKTTARNVARGLPSASPRLEAPPACWGFFFALLSPFPRGFSLGEHWGAAAMAAVRRPHAGCVGRGIKFGISLRRPSGFH